MSKQHDKPQPSDPSYQDKDINLTGVTLSLLGILAAAVVAMVVMFILFAGYNKKMYQEEQSLSALPPVRELPSEAILQTDEDGDLAEWLEVQHGKLNRYVWINKERGLAAIPIDAAKEAVLATGMKVPLSTSSASATGQEPSEAVDSAPAPQESPTPEPAPDA